MKNHLFLSVAAIALSTAFGFAAANADTLDAAGNVTSGVDVTTEGSSGSAKTDLNTAATVDTPNANISIAGAATASGSFTVDDINAERPFGDMIFDPDQTLEQLNMAMTIDQRMELDERCDVIVNNMDVYKTDTTQWCVTYIDWKKMHPQG